MMKQVKSLSFSIDSILQRVNNNKKLADVTIDVVNTEQSTPVKMMTHPPHTSPIYHTHFELVEQHQDRHAPCHCCTKYHQITTPVTSCSAEMYETRKGCSQSGDKRKMTTLLLEHGNLTSRRIGHPYKSRAPPKRKPCRNTFTQTQVVQLEKLFEQTRYLSSAERLRMARELNMTDNQLKTWYQNRRTKLKRELSEYYEQQRMKKYFDSA